LVGLTYTYGGRGKIGLKVIIAELTGKLPGVKLPTWQAIHNFKARCEETGSVAGLPQTSKPLSDR
jgi:hypothetical protein